MGLSRRAFVGAAAGGAALATAGSVPAAAQSGPDYGGWFDNVDNYDGTVDKTGQDTVEVTVGAAGNGGAFAFGPAAVRVSPGTEVVWKWTGDGGGHNVVSEGDGPLDSGSAVADSGTTYSHTFESEGIYKYACTPHKALGMKGAVVVGGSSGGGGSGGDSDEGSRQSSDGPDYGGWFDDVDNYDGTTADKTGQDTVEITVGAAGNGGGFAFDPPAVRVTPGTEVVWTWTGEGGAHNVVSDGDGPLDSGETATAAGTTYSHTFEDEGIYKYVCMPHKAMGMKGAVVVEESSSSGGDGAGGTRGTATGLSGPQWLLSGSIVLAFISPLLFAAVLRRKGSDDRQAVSPRTAD